mmetsp:Transcript_29971/g.93808  ORF Transcript_29971/g.93808 Transcript_29971/m.93808 type:complete len:530 (-) Transcript_29971:13-1602(-)
MQPTRRVCAALASRLAQRSSWPPRAGVPELREEIPTKRSVRGGAAAGSTTWVDEASRKPVSQETLAGIPWAGRSTLAGLFTRVAACGPHDPTVWRKLVSRADVIAHSFTAKQAALVLSALARAQHRGESFLRRFSVRFAPSLLQEAELLDLCGIISSLSQLGAYSKETFALAAKRAAVATPQMDARQISLVANAFVRVGHADRELFERLLHQVPRRLRGCTARDIAVLLNALAQLPGLLPDELPATSLEPQLEAIALRLPNLLPTADLHSLTLILNAFAQLGFVQKDVLDLIVEELLSDKEHLRRITPRQLAMVLNTAARLQLYEPRLLDALVLQIRLRAKALDAHSLCVVANACAKLPALGVETFQALYTQVPRLLTRFSGRQLAMLCHAWGKAHVHNDDLFALLALPLARKAKELTAYEVALTVYGYAHFRKAPPEIFGPLLERFAALLESEHDTVKDGVLLMLANALGRVGWRDAAVAKRLQDYVAREPSMRNVLPQTAAVFELGGLGAVPDEEPGAPGSEGPGTV